MKRSQKPKTKKPKSSPEPNLDHFDFIQVMGKGAFGRVFKVTILSKVRVDFFFVGPHQGNPRNSGSEANLGG
jgi:hypothetical protein